MFVWNRLPRAQALVSGKKNILGIFFYQKQVPVALGIFFLPETSACDQGQ
jgi:hypothetical protein